MKKQNMIWIYPLIALAIGLTVLFTVIIPATAQADEDRLFIKQVDTSFLDNRTYQDGTEIMYGASIVTETILINHWQNIGTAQKALIIADLQTQGFEDMGSIPPTTGLLG